MIAFLTAIPVFLQALPALFQLAVQFMALVQKLVNWAEKKELSKWMENLENRIDELEKAKTPEEKRDAAKKLSDIIRGLG